MKEETKQIILKLILYKEKVLRVKYAGLLTILFGILMITLTKYKIVGVFSIIASVLLIKIYFGIKHAFYKSIIDTIERNENYLDKCEISDYIVLATEILA